MIGLTPVARHPAPSIDWFAIAPGDRDVLGRVDWCCCVRSFVTIRVCTRRR